MNNSGARTAMNENIFARINFTNYFIFTCVTSIFLSTAFLENIPADTLRDQLHALLTVTTYGIMYQLPAIVGFLVLKRWKYVAAAAGILLAISGHVLVFGDSRLYDLYGFHINGFVWNLVTTRGGIDSLGADQTNTVLVLGYAAALVALHALALLFSARLPVVRVGKKTAIALFLLATLSERLIYGYSLAGLYGPVLERGDAFPLYTEMKINSLLEQLGVEVKKTEHIKLGRVAAHLDYPKHKIVHSETGKPVNILVLVSESMRWDLLDPVAMPRMSEFATRAWRFSNHYSGGNGTRQGMFALFYGIYGNYWDAFLRARRGPVLFELLNEYNYQYFVHTSASFTYPEFDKTIFSGIPATALAAASEGEPWVRDRNNTTALLDDIKNRDQSRPFFGFMFYEATHARYSFSDESIVDDNYLRNVDYFGLSRAELAPQIESLKARYINAAHGIDAQLQRIVEYLETSGDIDNTIVVITGDHGEEFMERGRWGHNSDFTDWQVHVPMIVWVPGEAPKTITQRTSHVDIVPTLLARLGVSNNILDYSLGEDLSDPVDARSIVVASWSDIGIINDFGKLAIPLKNTTQHQNLALNTDDTPTGADTLVKQMHALIPSVLSDMRIYTGSSAQAADNATVSR